MDKEVTIEEITNDMDLPEVLLILQSICYAKADQENWQEAREWKTTGNTLGKWAKSLVILN